MSVNDVTCLIIKNMPTAHESNSCYSTLCSDSTVSQYTGGKNLGFFDRNLVDFNLHECRGEKNMRVWNDNGVRSNQFSFHPFSN